MKYSQSISLLLILGIFVIAGCKGNTGPSTSASFIGGSSGVNITFMAAAPMDSFNVGDSAPVKVALVNNGEYDLNAGDAQVRIWGIQLSAFGLSDQYKGTTNALAGKKLDLKPEGSEQDIDMGTIQYNANDIINSEQFTIKANVCYPYATVASLNACITSNTIENAGGQKACSFSTSNIVTGGDVSSGPVQLTSATEKLRGSDQILIQFTIQNKGAGKVYKASSSCTDTDNVALQSDIANIVDVKLPEEYQCFDFLDKSGSSGEVRLSGGTASVNCYTNVNQSSSFTDKLRVELNYRYIDTTSKNIIIYQTTTASSK